MTRALTAHQLEAVEKFSRLKVGALFMEMGAGKTQAAVSIVNTVDDIDLLLLVCPCRVKENLLEEFGKCGCRYAPEIVGVESIGMSDRIYMETLQKLRKASRAFIVVDESIKIKNMQAKRTKRLLELAKYSEYRLILNGTPITKSIVDVYAQMRFLSPKILDMTWQRYRDCYCSYREYKRYGRTYKTVITGYENVEHLLSIIGPYIYQCKLNIPNRKKYNVVRWSMTETERREYEDFKKRLLSFRNESGGVDLLGIMQKLQHFYCLHPGKIEATKGLVDEKTIIFCRFIKSAEEMREKYPQALVLTYGKGSFGLNLQAYNRIIYFDKTWDYAFREQSEARIYRTGQQDDCEYYDITGAIGLDGLIDKCISKKITLVERFKAHGNELLKELQEVL